MPPIRRREIVWSVAITKMVSGAVLTARSIYECVCALFNVDTFVIGRRLLDTGDLWNCHFTFKDAVLPLAKTCIVNGAELYFDYNRDLRGQCSMAGMEFWTQVEGITHVFPAGHRVDMLEESDTVFHVDSSMESKKSKYSFGAIYVPRVELTADQIIEHYEAQFGKCDYIVGSRGIDKEKRWYCYFSMKRSVPYDRIVTETAVNGQKAMILTQKLGSVWFDQCRSADAVVNISR